MIVPVPNDGRRFRRSPRTIPMPDRSRHAGGAGPACARGLFLDRIPRGQPGAPGSAAAHRNFAVQPGEVVIETCRLVLRRHRDADFPDYFAMCADPEMSRFSGKDPAGSDEAWMRLLKNVGHWSILGYGFFAVEEKATGRLVGEAGLGDFRRQLGPAFGGPEAGWAITPSHQGRGYATEAAAAALEWFEARFGIDRTVCLIHAGNVASRRVAEKLGYAPSGACSYRGYSAITFERLRTSDSGLPHNDNHLGNRHAEWR